MYQYRLKEIEVGDTEIRKGVKTTVSSIDPETGAVTYDVENVADFTSTYKELEKAKDFLLKLEKTGKSKDDPAIDRFAAQIKDLFNTFRTHIRRNYPEEYERVLRLKESVNEQSEQWTQGDVINVDKSLRLALKTFNNLVKNLERLEKELNKHSNKSQGDLLQKMVPDSFDYLGVQNKLLRLYKAFNNAFGSTLKENALQGPQTKDVYMVGDAVIYKRGNVAKSGRVELRTKDFEYYVKDDSDGKGYLIKRDDIVGLNLEEQSSTAMGGDAFAGGVGAQYATPRAFNKNKKDKGAASIYYYKLGYKPVPKIKPKSYDIKKLFEYSDFQQKRITVFDEIEKKINSIFPLLSSAKNETTEFYNENPGSYAIVYSTDMVNELLDDIMQLLKQSK